LRTFRRQTGKRRNKGIQKDREVRGSRGGGELEGVQIPKEGE
jgi:hypothetical protein